MVTLEAYQDLAAFNLTRQHPTHIPTPFIEQLANITGHHPTAGNHPDRRFRPRLNERDKHLRAVP